MFLRQIIWVFLLCVYYLVRNYVFFQHSKTIVFYLMEVNILFKNIMLGDFYWIFVLVVW